jgi:signal transduction histidine kinase/CheY-like chemotaxis protein
MNLMRPEIAYLFVGGFYLAMSVLHFILYMYNRHRKANLVYSVGMLICFVNFTFIPISTQPNYLPLHDKINILLSTLSNGALLYFISYYVIAYLIPRYKKSVKIFGMYYITGFAALCFAFTSPATFYTIDLIIRTSLYLMVAVSCFIGLLKKVPNFSMIVIATGLLVATDVIVNDVFNLWEVGVYPTSRIIVILVGYTTPFIAYSTYLSKDLALTGKKLMREHIMNERLTREKYEQELVTRKLLEAQNVELERSVFERTREISHQKEELETQAEKIQEIDKIKSRFFANISHEFRTPLTLIQSPIKKRLSEASDPKDIKEYNIIYQNSTRLLQLVNQLLDLSRLESGTLTLKPKQADLITMLKPVVEAFQSLAEVKAIQFFMEFQSVPITGYFDQEKLEKIMNNLLSNAFKFTPPGGSVGVEIKACNGKAAFPDGFAQLTVSDNGVGISKQTLPRIFERFYQVDNSQTREFEGTGIGLSITKDFIELHEGTIQVESELGKGTKFIVCIPLGLTLLNALDTDISQSIDDAEPTNLPNYEEPFHENEKDLKKHKETILIVEDNVDLRYYIRENLPNCYHIIEACDGQEGIDMALQEIPDLIITDLMMPKVAGMELCKCLKTDEKTSHIPIIILTARADMESKLNGLNIGADDYISKPFDMHELEIRAHNLIESRKLLREKFASKMELKPKEITVQSSDDRFIQRILSIMETHIGDTSFGVDVFSHEAGMSNAQLYRKISALTGYTPNDFIRHMRLQRAADLFKQKAGNVAEIAYQVGFNNLSYFAKVFKEKFGVTPNEFLKNTVV